MGFAKGNNASKGVTNKPGRKPEELLAVLRTRDAKYAPVVYDELYRLATTADDESVRCRSCIALLEYIRPKPKQQFEITGGLELESLLQPTPPEGDATVTRSLRSAGE